MKKRLASFVAVAWCASLTLGASAPYVDFNQAPAFELPSSSQHCLAADFNNDGRPDLILSAGYTINSGSVLLLLNAGNRTFILQSSLYVGARTPEIAAADFNGDGILDVAASAGGNVSVFLGDGAGDFAKPVTYPYDVRLFTTADLNSDGAPDLVGASATTASVLFNDGLGRFTLSTAGEPESVQSLVVADFDLDGNLDLITTHYNETISLIRGNGDGTFQPDISLGTGSPSERVAVGDFNEDGRPDLVVFHRVTFSVWFGAQGGQVVFGGQIPIFLSENRQAETADLNHDGHADIIWAGAGATINIGIGDGSGRFNISHYGAAKTVATFAIADFDGDSRPDIAVPDAIGSTLTLLLNKGDGTFAGSEAFYPTSRLIDIDGDGRLDLIGGGGNTAQVFARRGNGDGTFGDLISFAMEDIPYSGAVGDLNNDGYQDYVALLYTNGIIGNRVGVLLGVGDGTFSNGPTHLLIGRSFDVALSDFNGDGKLDLVADGSGTNAGVCLGHGDGTFASELEIPGSANRIPIAIGDLNNDGNPDLVLRMDVYLGHGDASFSFLNTSTAGILNRPYLGDLNGDGNLDLVGISNYDGGTTIYAGDGNGNFSQLSHLSLGESLAAIADFNQDGKMDLAVTQSYSVAVLLGNGDGSFVIGGSFFAIGGPVVGDVNGDGLLDIVSGGHVLLNQTFTKLGLTHTSTGAVLTWPSYTAGLMLESTESLAAPDWRRVPAPVSVVDDRYVVTNATTRPTQFFRLRRQ